MDPLTLLLVGASVVGLIGIFTALSGLRVSNQYERGVVFRLGRLAGVRGPGLFYVTPWITSVRKVDLRTLSIEVPPKRSSPATT